MNVREFCSVYGIEYVEQGQNVARGHIAVNCPFCRAEHDPDPSYHMGISLSEDLYGCWRNNRHGGRTMWWLVKALIDCSVTEAKEIAGEQQRHEICHTDFLEQVEEVINGTEIKPLQEIDESTRGQWEAAKPIDSKSLQAERYRNYLSARGFQNIGWLAKNYGVRFATHGRWKQRIIFPIVCDGRVVAITARTIREDESLRYMTTSVKEGANIKDYLYLQSEVDMGGKALFIVEGVMDVIKLKHFVPEECEVTCVFSISVSDSQAVRVTLASRNFDKVFVLFDKGAYANAVYLERTKLRGVVSALDSASFLPIGIKDPGDIVVGRHDGYMLEQVANLFQ